MLVTVFMLLCGKDLLELLFLCWFFLLFFHLALLGQGLVWDFFVSLFLFPIDWDWHCIGCSLVPPSVHYSTFHILFNNFPRGPPLLLENLQLNPYSRMPCHLHPFHIWTRASSYDTGYISALKKQFWQTVSEGPINRISSSSTSALIFMVLFSHVSWWLRFSSIISAWEWIVFLISIFLLFVGEF